MTRRTITGAAAHSAGGVGRLTLQDPADIGLGQVVERYVSRRDGGRPRYRELHGGRYLHADGPERDAFTARLIEDAAAVTDDELAALLAYEWRSRLTASWLIGVDRRTSFRDRLADLLLGSEVCYAGKGYCFALVRFGTRADAAVLTAYLDRYLPRTDLGYDQPWALVALLRLDAELGTGYAGRFTAPGGLWDRWAAATGREPGPAGLTDMRRRFGLVSDHAHGWTRP